jgi:SAM-dependent methyltransferase
VPQFEPGSFRDPLNRIAIADGEVFRILSREGLEDWEALVASRLFAEATSEGSLVATEQLGDGSLPAGLRDSAGVLRHERIPFVSYPYEWPFSMLRDAALLHLDLLRRALDENLTLKDASPYNVQWRGAKPVFIDLGSFERQRKGEPWAGYRQFCTLFLYPLLLQALRGVDFRPLLRGSVDGIEPAQMRRLLPRRDLLRRGVLTHVTLHARLESHHADDVDVKRELRSAGFSTELVKANVRGLEKLVRRLDWEPGETAWTEYGATTTYSEADAERKAVFVREAASARHRNLVWDLGANDGRYTRIAAEHADYAVALDADGAVVERLYRELRAEGSSTILPLVANLADPPPGLGWRGRERKPLPERGRPDLTLALAVVHHLAIGANVPLAELVDWLAELGTELVIEFPTPDDPMVERMLARKREGTHADYTRETFEAVLGKAFALETEEELAGGTRVLYHAVPRRG